MATRAHGLRIVVVVLAVLLVGAGVYMYLGNGSSEAPASVQPVAVAAIDKGEVIKLEPIFINLKNDRFLKVGLALQTTLTGDDAELDGSMALDAAIEVFSNKDLEQVVTESWPGPAQRGFAHAGDRKVRRPSDRYLLHGVCYAVVVTRSPWMKRDS